jgi:hypothetical protein
MMRREGLVSMDRDEVVEGPETNESGGGAPGATDAREVQQPASRSPVEPAIEQGRDPGWEELLELADRVGPCERLAGLDDAALDRQVRLGAARMAAEMCRWLDLVAELVIRRVWADQGARTPAVWLSWAVGMSPTTARDRVRVALRLRELPRVREELAAGRVSYSKVRAITRVAMPETEELLLRWAGEATGAAMERIVAGFRTAQRARGAGKGEHETRDVRLRRRGDGTSEVVVRLPDDEALSLHAAILRLVDLEEAEAEARRADDEKSEAVPDAPAEAVAVAEVVADSAEAATARPVTGSRPRGSFSGSEPCGQPSPVSGAGEMGDAGVVPAVRDKDRPRGARMADALLVAVWAAVAAGGADTSGADRDTLVVHCNADDLAALRADERDLPVAVDTSQGTLPAMCRRVLRRMACEAGLVLVATDRDGTPMDVGRRERRLSTALRRALLARDRSCRFPGCDARRHLHGHHIWHWADGGPTDLDNLVLLCAFHHRYVHQHDIDIRLRTGSVPEFRRPDGRRIATTRPLPVDDADARQPRRHTGPVATHPPQAPGLRALEPDHWDGRYDLDLTVAVLQQQMRTVLPHVDAVDAVAA